MRAQLDSSSITELNPSVFAYRMRIASDTSAGYSFAMDCTNLRMASIDAGAWNSVVASKGDSLSWEEIPFAPEFIRRSYGLVCAGHRPGRWIRILDADTAADQGPFWLDLQSIQGPHADSVQLPGRSREAAPEIIDVWLRLDAIDSTRVSHTLFEYDVACDLNAFQLLEVIEYKDTKMVDQEQPHGGWQKVIPGTVGEHMFPQVCEIRRVLGSGVKQPR